MKITRYSFNSFKPQFQSHHLKHVNYHLHDFKVEDVPSHLRSIVLERHKELIPFYKENYADFQFGVWAFIDGYKNNQSLNHFKRRVPCWNAEITNDVIVYGVNWEVEFIITDPRCRLFGFYLPAKELNKLSNVQRI